jgi:IMP dehydrogenase
LTSLTFLDIFGTKLKIMTEHQFKYLPQAYSFDEVAIVPGDFTIHPEQTDVSFEIGELKFSIPILAAAMDAVVDIKSAILLSQLGGLAVLNLEGLSTRYEHPEDIVDEIIQSPSASVNQLLQKVYIEPIKLNLIGERVEAVKKAGVCCAVSLTPANTKKLAPLAVEAGTDVLVVQSTVTTARHYSKSPRGLIFPELCQSLSIPVIVGNCVTYNAAMELMETGVAGILVGVGPGATCTTREVLGIGIPQATATMDCAAARDSFFRETGRYVAIITDGGISNGGDLCKAIACGADAVMLGAILAQADEAPGKGYHWGMASFHSALPRGTRIKVDALSPLKQILFGPSSVSNGRENLIGALRTTMGICGVANIREMHQVKMTVSPSIKTEGKLFQSIQFDRA